MPILRTRGHSKSNPLIFVNCGDTLFIYFGFTACGILVPQPGIKPMPAALAVWSLNHQTAREVPEATLVLDICLRRLLDKTILLSICVIKAEACVLLIDKDTFISTDDVTLHKFECRNRILLIWC